MSVIDAIARRSQRLPTRVARAAVRDLGVSPRRVGYRWMEPQGIRQYVQERLDRASGGEYEVVDPPERASNPLPQNIGKLEELPADRGWWGYSFRDVPTRLSGETLIATVEGCRVVPFLDRKSGEFHVCIATSDDRVLEIREMAFRPGHARVFRSSRNRRVGRATWILERVYHNHSHWLTAHLPKVLIARGLGLLSETFLPGSKTNGTIEHSLGMLGIERGDAPPLDLIEPLRVDELTVLVTDRFRPRLLRSVRDAFRPWISGARSRRLYVSRARAARRRLVNEEDVWPILQEAGFERVFMEDLPFEEQVRMMGEAEAVVAPHGAGLTNVMFCPRETAVVEIADLSFPNPNFYAVASAMEHRYSVLSAETRGEGHPLERDMWVDPGSVSEVLDTV